MPNLLAPPNWRLRRGWRVWLAGWLMLLGTWLQAQAPALRRFDQHDGLPQSQIMSLLEDRSGFLWVGTMDGVARMGPSGFQAFDSSLGLGFGQVMAMLEDREGGIWVASSESGVTHIRGRKVTTFGPAQGLGALDAYCLLESRSGELFVGTRVGLFRLRGERFEQVDLPGNWKYSPIFALAQDGNDQILLGSRAGKLASWDGRDLQTVGLPEQSNPERVVALRSNPDGSIWMLQNSRLLRREKGLWRVEALPGLPSMVKMSTLALGNQGELLIALGSDGLYVRSPDGRGKRLGPQEGFPRYPINCAIRDRHGLLWIGTDGDHLHAQAFGGLKTLVRNPEPQAPMDLGSVTAFQELPGNRMLIGSAHGVSLWEEGRGILRQWQQREGLPVNEVWALYPDGEGGTWVGTIKGIARLGADGRLRPGPRELATANVGKILVHLGRVWVASDLGLMELDLSGRFLAKHTPPQEVGFPDVNNLRPRPWGLLVGTRSGLYTFREGQFRKTYPTSPVALSSIIALHEDPQGQLWVATLQGLFCLDRQTHDWKNFLAPNGRPLTGVTWICTLPSGVIAVGHGRGVLLVDAKGASVHLTRRLGLLSDETNQEAILVDRRGRLWMGLVGGACILEPSRVFSALPLPPPVVMEVSWEGGSAWKPGDLQLPPRSSGLAITFDTGMPSTSLPPRYEVRLVGLDATWRPVEGNNTSVQFGRLEPGTYRFQARNSLDGRSWAESAPLILHVQRAWFQTYWARGAFVLVGVGALFLLIKWRLTQLEQRNRDLETRIEARTRELALRNKSMERLHHQLKRTLESRLQMVNTVSHDLRSPLTSILLSVDRIQETTGEMSAGLTKTLGVLEREARRLEAIVKGLLDRSRSESMTDSLNQRLCHPSEILNGLTDTLRLKAEARDLRSHLDLDPADEEVWILADTTGLQQTLFNLLENALKFTEPPGLVGVRSRVDGAQWVLEVWDTGRGIPADKLEKIFLPFEQTENTDAQQGWGLGLAICRNMVQGHEGRLEVESELGKGSLFRVILPLVMANS